MSVKSPETNTTPEQTQTRVTKDIVSKGKKAVKKQANRLEKLKVEYVPIDDVKPNAYNPNRQDDHDFELLVKSMEEDGFTQPIVVLEDLTIVDGEHRWRAAHTLGYQEIPVVKTNMTPEQMRISTLRHNRARGSEDIELTASLLKDLEELGALDWAQDSLMMDDTEIDRLLEDIPVADMFAGDEFEGAWEPDTIDESEGQATAENVNVRTIENSRGEEIATAMTYDAVEKSRAREKELAKAVSEEQRLQIKKESKFFRVSLLLAGEEAVLVKKVLGKTPAETLVALCTEKAKQKEYSENI